MQQNQDPKAAMIAEFKVKAKAVLDKLRTAIYLDDALLIHNLRSVFNRNSGSEETILHSFLHVYNYMLAQNHAIHPVMLLMYELFKDSDLKNSSMPPDEFKALYAEINSLFEALIRTDQEYLLVDRKKYQPGNMNRNSAELFITSLKGVLTRQNLPQGSSSSSTQNVEQYMLETGQLVELIMRDGKRVRVWLNGMQRDGVVYEENFVPDTGIKTNKVRLDPSKKKSPDQYWPNQPSNPFTENSAADFLRPS